MSCPWQIALNVLVLVLVALLVVRAQPPERRHRRREKTENDVKIKWPPHGP